MCDVPMCGSQSVQVIDNTPLSMLGNKISTAHFVGLKNPREQTRKKIAGKKKLQRDYTAGTDRLTDERGTEGERESNLLEIKSDRKDRRCRKRRNYGSVSPFALSSRPLSAIRVLHHSGSHLP